MKQNKLIVAVHPDPDIRRSIMKRIVVERGFALIASDAGKLIRHSISDVNIESAYFVIADNYNFRTGPITQHRLYELAARGIAVILGTRRLPSEYEFICEAYFE